MKKALTINSKRVSRGDLKQSPHGTLLPVGDARLGIGAGMANKIIVVEV